MENLVIEKGIAFHAQSYTDAMQIEKLRIEFTSKDVKNIVKAVELVRSNDFISHIEINHDGDIQYLDDDENIFDGWAADLPTIQVFNNVLYYSVQNRNDAGDEIQSEGIYLNELGINL
jgi:hypothetical protein